MLMSFDAALLIIFAIDAMPCHYAMLYTRCWYMLDADRCHYVDAFMLSFADIIYAAFHIAAD